MCFVPNLSISLPLRLITRNSSCDFGSIGFTTFSPIVQSSGPETSVSSDDRVLSLFLHAGSCRVKKERAAGVAVPATSEEIPRWKPEGKFPLFPL